jgi:hypothetical protein
MKRGFVCWTTALSVLLLAQVTWVEAASAPKRGGVLRTAVNYDPPHWDPQITLSYQTHTLGSFVYSKLLRDKQGETHSS